MVNLAYEADLAHAQHHARDSLCDFRRRKSQTRRFYNLVAGRSQKLEADF